MLSSFYMNWQHVFKLDPDRPIGDEALHEVCMSGTDAILVGGSSGVTFDNTVDLLSRIRRYEVPCALELTDPDAAVPGFDGYFVPMVLNTPDSEWLIGRQAEALTGFGHLMPWDLMAGEAYLVLNADCTAARVSGAQADLSAEQAVAYAQLADRLMRVPVLYLEYSGAYGDMALVRSVRQSLQQAQLFYGGGIRTPEQAREAAQAAHTVVVGNVVYDDLQAALLTVPAVKSSAKEQDHVF
ncbi:heptaprenylglyceryl phosphate synthase [Cohnella lubricantis]|uniref:Heptaprenylglyceryl phosphate synthase n=1 Tax=Cohnella lubricantis TaxID=2163172 RepID=A0A841TKU0_9BACL|nr:heptaprenylglyceryl phosphate synthase [Cohnella lubricantis]MBB6679810.1 heptaprenylglyceryl phosphate synthase [Cohnella lubricantis]MBP2118772.1 putative glycerol-1-phosphate prenyltransferase [Cohnella lubricantis]